MQHQQAKDKRFTEEGKAHEKDAKNCPATILTHFDEEKNDSLPNELKLHICGIKVG